MFEAKRTIRYIFPRADILRVEKDRGEQIEKMIKTLCVDYGTKCGVCGCKPCAFIEHCKALYNAGYREQIEAEWILSEFGDDAACSACREAPYDFKFPFQEPEQAQWCPCCGARMRGVNYGELITWEEMKAGGEQNEEK